jgi:2-aminoethylphosphonate-pyruvate transaminase
MAQDFAPWDNDFRPLYAGIRDRVLALAGGTPETHATLPLQGCGHFAMEATVRTFVPPGGKVLIPMTGQYAERLRRLTAEAGRVVVDMDVPHDLPVDPGAVARALAGDQSIGHVGMVYSETSSGVIHDPLAIGHAVRAAGRRLILDAVSAFGALPLDVAAQPELDAVVFTANKCLEGMPGLAFTVARIDSLERAGGNAGSWSFDLADIFNHAVRSGWGSFRFTPPAQVLAACGVALDLHAAEGGRPARLARYRANADALYAGMRRIGLQPCLLPDVQGPIVQNIHAPDDTAWHLQSFVDALKRRGFLISNFHNTPGPSIRVGCIGAVTPDDMRAFVRAVDATLDEIGIRNRAPARAAA